ncbi:hypothetical protein ART_0626 [Arthrobacter sp. PAMC 25486]|uniref:hypothetical protein n=1 Tax=Arthrobacter sp. PAMC 25486 TaxID=1494608 RepID=UPI000535DBC6|nr:hypothetical protein [Arthrobacter sp. PAMC 25486]AIY00225.1 hypothetical protein ART_0626 [Arthrobacter sp. PAMC 25486]
MSTVFPEAPHDALDQAVINMHRSREALGLAAEALEVPVSAQMARGVQATENAWRDIESEFGMLTGAEVAALLGSNAKSPTGFATDRRKAGKLLGIKRKNAFLYPGFQFVRRANEVRPVIAALLEIIAKYQRSAEDLTQWLCTRTGQLDDDRPVDRLDEPAVVLEAAKNHYGVQW